MGSDNVTTTMATEVKKAVDLGLLEEDDEFEEFPAEKWESKDEDPADVNVWEDNWDDDTVEDDFSIQLSKYQRKRKLSHSPPLRSPEPSAKKSRDSRNTPSPSQQQAQGANGLSNGNARIQNGSPTGFQHENMQTDVVQRTPSSRRRNANRDKTPDPNPPVRTRSSARLRSSKK